jgi:isopenicillin N synthase-like dioxygenase
MMAEEVKGSVLTDLERKFHAAVPFSMSHEEIEQAVGKFFAFLALSQEAKDALHMKRPNDPVTDIGYMRAKGEKGEDAGRRDFKEYFHFHPDVEEAWGRLAAEEPAIREFFDAAGRIWVEADRAGRETLRLLDAEIPGICDAFFPEEKPTERILRFLKYDNNREGKFLARAHYDRGGCTLALAESAPGLRIGKDEETLAPVVHQDHTAVFFAAPHLSQLSGGRVKAAWHDVVQASDDVFSPDAARWAVVYFMNAPALPFPTSDETHAVMK